jgi:hypothetical protein
MSTPRIKRKEALGRDLLGEEQLFQIRTSGNLDAGAVEFAEHECWQTLHVWPDDVDTAIPGRIECFVCGTRGRFELEYKA